MPQVIELYQKLRRQKLAAAGIQTGSSGRSSFGTNSGSSSGKQRAHVGSPAGTGGGGVDAGTAQVGERLIG